MGTVITVDMVLMGAGALLLFLAQFDRTIGRANSIRLRRALGHPTTVFLPTGHYTSYLLLPYIQYESVRFFKKRL